MSQKGCIVTFEILWKEKKDQGDMTEEEYYKFIQFLITAAIGEVN